MKANRRPSSRTSSREGSLDNTPQARTQAPQERNRTTYKQYYERLIMNNKQSSNTTETSAPVRKPSSMSGSNKTNNTEAPTIDNGPGCTSSALSNTQELRGCTPLEQELGTEIVFASSQPVQALRLQIFEDEGNVIARCGVFPNSAPFSPQVHQRGDIEHFVVPQGYGLCRGKNGDLFWLCLEEADDLAALARRQHTLAADFGCGDLQPVDWVPPMLRLRPDKSHGDNALVNWDDSRLDCELELWVLGTSKIESPLRVPDEDIGILLPGSEKALGLWTRIQSGKIVDDSGVPQDADIGTVFRSWLDAVGQGLQSPLTEGFADDS